MINDGGSCENAVSTHMVEKLALKTVDHPEPYQFTWLKKRNANKVSKRCLVEFSAGRKYKDKVWCEVIPMDACHILFDFKKTKVRGRIIIMKGKLMQGTQMWILRVQRTTGIGDTTHGEVGEGVLVLFRCLQVHRKRCRGRGCFGGKVDQEKAPRSLSYGSEESSGIDIDIMGRWNNCSHPEYFAFLLLIEKEGTSIPWSHSICSGCSDPFGYFKVVFGPATVLLGAVQAGAFKMGDIAGTRSKYFGGSTEIYNRIKLRFLNNEYLIQLSKEKSGINRVYNSESKARGAAPWTLPGDAAPWTLLPGALPPDPRHSRLRPE
nr:reverse transcriptase domain-containing protein [Tanacetum cinerariifolium]